MNVTAVAIFALSYLICVFCGYKYLNVGGNIGELLKIPAYYSISCYVFVAVLAALAVFGCIYKNRLMLFLAAGYELVFILGFAMLAFSATGAIGNDILNTAAVVASTVAIIPVYGVIWHINWLFFVLFAAITVFGVVAIIKALKRK